MKIWFCKFQKYPDINLDKHLETTNILFPRAGISLTVLENNLISSKQSLLLSGILMFNKDNKKGLTLVLTKIACPALGFCVSYKRS